MLLVTFGNKGVAAAQRGTGAALEVIEAAD
jgi:hypothetical protein